MNPEQEVEKIVSEIELNKKKENAIKSLRRDVEDKVNELYRSCGELGINIEIELPSRYEIPTLDGSKQSIFSECYIELSKKIVY